MTQRYSLKMVDPDKLNEDVRRVTMVEAAKIVQKKAKALAPRGGGSTRRPGKKSRKRLRNTINRYVSRDGRTVAVYARAPHAHLVHEGTKPHVIRFAHTTHLRIGGRVITMKAGAVIRHPGARKNPFLVNAAEQSRGEVEAAIKGAV